MPDNIIEKYLDYDGLKTYDSKIKEVIQKDLASAWVASTSYVVGQYVVYNGLLYRCKTAHTSGTTFSDTNWDQVKVIDIIGTKQDALQTQTAYSAVGSSTKIPIITTNTLGQVTAISTADVVSANDGKLTINGATSSDKIEFTANQSGDTTGTIDKTFVGLGNVVNTADSATPTSGGTTKFTTGGAYTLKQDLLAEIRTQSAHFRGNFANWTAVPTSDSGYIEDTDGSKTPTVNDYIIIEDATDYSSSNQGAWRFIYTGVWATDGKSGWAPAYAIDTPITGVLASIAGLTTGTGLVKLTDGTASLDTNNYALASDLANYITTNTTQTGLTGNKTFSGSAFRFNSSVSSTISHVIIDYTNIQVNAGPEHMLILPDSLSIWTNSYTNPNNKTVYKDGQIIYTFDNDSSNSATLTLPRESGTLALLSDIPALPTKATSSTLGIVKLASDTVQSVAANAVSSTASRTYGVQLNSSDQMVVNVPWTDTATAADGIFHGSNSGTAITYAPYSSDTATSTWVSNDSNAGKFYLGTQNPSKTTRLNYNGYLYATKLYSGGNETLTTGSAYVSDSQINGTSIVSNHVANFLTKTAYDSSSNKVATEKDIPYVNMTYTAGTSGSANTTTWSYRAAGATGDPLTVTFNNITTAEINSLFS